MRQKQKLQKRNNRKESGSLFLMNNDGDGTMKTAGPRESGPAVSERGGSS